MQKTPSLETSAAWRGLTAVRTEPVRMENACPAACALWLWLLLDSRVVDVPMAYNSTFVMLSSLKPLLFNSLKNEVRFSDNAGAEAPGIQ
jgi:hypothetical protein